MKVADILQPKIWLACTAGALAVALLPPFAFAGSAHLEPGHGVMRDDSSLVGEGWRERALSNEAAVPFRKIVDEQGVVSIVPTYHGWGDDVSIENHCVRTDGRYSSNRVPSLRRGRMESVCDSVEAVYEVEPLGSLDHLPLTDIYDITLIELPEEPAVPALPGWLGSSNLILPGSVANDGTVAATRKMVNSSSMWHKLVRLRPGSMNWENLASTLNVLQNPIISHDGDSIVFTVGSRRPAIFRNGAFNYLPNLVYDSQVNSASDDFSHFAGLGLRPDPDPEETSRWIAAWAWGAEDGQIDLPALLPWPRAYTPLTYRVRDRWLPPDIVLISPYATTISNDGRRVVGIWGSMTRLRPDGYLDLGGNFGVYWQGDEEIRIIRGQSGEYLGAPLACDANCDTVFGNGYWRHYQSFPQSYLYGQSDHAWYWKPATGESGSLGALNPTQENPEGWFYMLFDVSGDGELAVGYYKSPEMAGGLPNGTSAYDALIWSQATGFVLLSEVLAETGLSLDWPAVYAHSISSSGEYILLTTGEVYTAPGQVGVPSLAKMALLRLTPKAP
ncbi:MAG: hypothetical protein R3F10_11680 [Lysobacteraceae bacterium]